MSAFDFKDMETGKKYRFTTEEKRTAFIENGMRPCDLEFADDRDQEVDVSDSPVITANIDAKPVNMSLTIDAIGASIAEVTKIALDRRVGMPVIRHLIDAQESIEQAFLYMTDKSYKGSAQ